MRLKSPAYLWDICNAADYIQAKIASITYEQFSEDLDTQIIVERKLEVIGEAGRRLFAHDPETAALIPGLRGAIDMRNAISHEYDDLDYVDIWSAITGPLNHLRDAAAQLLESED
jgi:uncharacterized protein with HEPN domain